MRHPYLLLSLSLLSLSCSCSSDLTEEITTPSHQVNTPMATPTDENLFPQEDGSPRPSYDPAEALSQLLKKFDPTKALVMGETEIKEAEFQEIKEFVDQNLKADTPLNTYKNIYSWITKNIRYAGANETAYLNPYEVFKHRVCVCQGFANLLKTMCITQDIPAMVVNGWLSDIGGHAWNYVYVGKEWYVSDPTNKRDYPMNNLNAYRNWLIPARTDLNLFEDEKFCYNFQDNHLTLSEVKPTGQPVVTVPYSVAGYKITSFCPQVAVDTAFTQLYVGKNIECFGNNPSTVINNFPSLERIEVQKGNPRLEAFNSLLYIDGNETPYFVPPAIRRVELRPLKVLEKNTLYDLPNVEEIVVAEGTVRIENYAFEKCPKLLRIYVPKSVTYIAREAIYNCNKDVEIIREQTGITEVTR